MDREIERKFFFDPRLWSGTPVRSTPLDQGYLSDTGAWEIRLRRSGNEHRYTMKTGDGLDRGEWEVKLAPSDFEALWTRTLGLRITKLREKYSWKGHTVEVDRYGADLEGLWVAGIDLRSEVQEPSLGRFRWLGFRRSPVSEGTQRMGSCHCFDPAAGPLDLPQGAARAGDCPGKGSLGRGPGGSGDHGQARGPPHRFALRPGNRDGEPPVVPTPGHGTGGPVAGARTTGSQGHPFVRGELPRRIGPNGGPMGPRFQEFLEGRQVQSVIARRSRSSRGSPLLWGACPRSPNKEKASRRRLFQFVLAGTGLELVTFGL